MTEPRSDGPQYERLYRECGARLDISQDQIRAVTLHPAEFGETLVCSLDVLSLKDASYEALSYTWGPASLAPSDSDGEWEDVDEDDGGEEEAEEHDEHRTSDESEPSETHAEHDKSSPSVMIVNSIPVPVMPNLTLALQHIRHSTRTQTLWIDYLCINQASVSDRNTQVPRMDMIYRHASRVIVWIGAESATSDQALDLVLAMNSSSHLTDIYASALPNKIPIQKAIRPLIDLLSRQWWSRIWVIQEVCLAREAVVRVGRRTVPWDWFVVAARTFGEHLVCCAAVVGAPNLTGSQDEFAALRTAWTYVLSLDQCREEDLSLHRALRLTSNRECTDPRDRVFGLLGLLPPANRIVEVDYGRPAEQVFEETALAVMRATGDLSIMLDADEEAGQVPDTATWAPDWTLPAVSGINFEEFFATSGSLPADFDCCGPHVLRVAGSIFDNIVAVDDGSWSDQPDENLLFDAYDGLKRWEEMSERKFKGPCRDPDAPEYRDYWLAVETYLSGEERQRALMQTVQLGMNVDRSGRFAKDDYPAYQRWRTWLKRLDRKSSRKGAAMSSDDSDVQQRNEILIEHIRTRWFFLTEDGFMGMGPKYTEPDDSVAVIAGSSLPLVLRPIAGRCPNCGPEQIKYQVLGWAYVHGIMDGEAVKEIEDESSDITWDSFCLI